MGKVIGGVVLLIVAGLIYSRMHTSSKPEALQAVEQAPAVSAPAPKPEEVSAGVSKQNTTEVKSQTPPAKLSDYDLQKEIEKRFESSYKEETDKEDAAAKQDFFKFVHENFNLRPDQEEQVQKLESEMNDELLRAGNDAQKDRIIQEYASRLVPILGRPQQ
jgi:cell division protein FtsN